MQSTVLPTDVADLVISTTVTARNLCEGEYVLLLSKIPDFCGPLASFPRSPPKENFYKFASRVLRARTSGFVVEFD